MRGRVWLAGGALTGLYLVGAPLLHIAGPNYHHPVPAHAVAVHHSAPVAINPYLPLQSPAGAPTSAHSATSGSGIRPHVRPYRLWRMTHPHGTRGAWRLPRRRNRNG